MSLHDRIIGMRFERPQMPELKGYNEGIKRAAQIAKEADDLMAEMAEILDCCGMGMVCHNRARSMVKKYSDWKEPTK